MGIMVFAINRRIQAAAFGLLFSCLTLQFAIAGTIYVDSRAPGGGNGLSWATAYQSLQSAVEATQQISEFTEIRVAAGLYTPTALTEPGNPSSASFVLHGNLAIRGGYAGSTGPQPDLRNISRFATILSGDLHANDGPSYQNYADNARIILKANVHVASAVLDGLFIENGLSAIEIIGGNLTLVNCNFSHHSLAGPGYVILNRDGNLSMTDCRVTDCGDWDVSPTYGALRCDGTSTTKLTNCIIANIAGSDGAAIGVVNPASVSCINSIFANNFGYYSALVNSGRLTLTNCAILSNASTPIVPEYINAAGLTTYNGTTSIENCIFWNNRNQFGITQESQLRIHPGFSGQIIINHSCVQEWTGSLGGIGNFGDDPRFCDSDGADNVPNTTDDDFRLRDDSPCLDAGNNFADIDIATPGAQPIPPVDLNGNPRFIDDVHALDVGKGSSPIIDIGPYEGSVAQIKVSQTEVFVPDSGTASFDVWLPHSPPGPVTISIAQPPSGPITVSATRMPTFTSQNYNIPRPITIRSIADAGFIHDRIRLHISAPSFEPIDVFATQNDADLIPETVFVNPAAVGLKTGMNWANAFRSLQYALDVAETHHQIKNIWVAEGRYVPERRLFPSSKRSITFRIPEGLSIYGGFAGTESSLEQRIPNLHESVLSGDLSNNDNGDFDDDSSSENAFTVITIRDAKISAKLDGFTITGGYANKPDPQYNLGTGAGLCITNGDAVLDNVSFQNNFAFYGGAISLDQFSRLQVSNSEFVQNLATRGSGAINNNQGELIVDICDFIDNRVDDEDGTAGAIGSGGRTTISDSNFVGNQAGSAESESAIIGSYGGAIVCSGEVAILRCDFTDNYANNAGAVSIFNDEPSSIINCNFIDNTAEERAGALDLSSTKPFSIRNCLFDGNRLQGDLFPDAAAIRCSYQSRPQISGCKFINNGASSYWSRSGVLGFETGTGERGLLKDCIFENNFGAQLGVGYFSGYDINGCTFSHNFAGEVGAIAVDNTDIINCRFHGNRAPGGGVLLHGQGTIGLGENSNLVNCVVSGNSSEAVGGVFSSYGNAVSLSNCSIYNNVSTQGPGGVRFSGNHPTITNCIIEHHSIDIDGSGALIQNSCIQHLPPEYNGYNNISADPLFIDRDGPDNIIGTMDDNPIIAAASPCANAGDNNISLLPQFDILGNVRIQACRVDMGAAETDAYTFHDCNNNGIHDDCEVQEGRVNDCNNNSIPDTCDVANGIVEDVNQNSIPDSCEQLILRVSATAGPGGDGRAWRSALNNLQEALSIALSHDAAVEIWVAAGTYQPSSAGAQEIAFRVSNNVTLLGGFAGNETDASQRDYFANETILSGDYPVYDSNNVLELSNATNSTIVDGCTIRNSNSSGGSNGGGIYVYNGSPTIRNCKLVFNRGRALLIQHGSPYIVNCQISWNISSSGGATSPTGVQVDLESSAVFENCSFEQNQRTSIVVENYSTATLRSCKINQNGGGMWLMY